MLCNRRCIKILEEIKNTAPGEVEDKCRYVFNASLMEHRKAIHKILQHRLDTSLPRNKQSLHATQLAVCLAMMVSSKFSNTSLLRWEFDKLDELRDEVESWFSLGKKIGLPVSGSKAVGVAGFVPVSGAYLASAIIVAGSDDNIFGSAVSMMRHYYVPDNIALLNILSIHPTKDKSRQTRLSELCGIAKDRDSGRELECTYNLFRYSASHGRDTYRRIQRYD